MYVCDWCVIDYWVLVDDKKNSVSARNFESIVDSIQYSNRICVFCESLFLMMSAVCM